MTTTSDRTVADALDEANPTDIADAYRKVKMGMMLTPTNPSLWATGANATGATGVTLPAPGARLGNVRVATGGSGGAGVYLIADSGATPAYPGSGAVGVASLSADGRVLTFPMQVQNVVLNYIPRSNADITSDLTD